MKELADWFPDTGANHHVTPDINGMTSVNPYLSNDQLHVGDGKGLVITNIAKYPKKSFYFVQHTTCP